METAMPKGAAQSNQACPRVKIAPSILASDFARLGEELARVEQSGADMAHIDVMDGMFVPNISIGPAVVKALRARSSLPFDVHLMIEEPDRYLGAFAEAGASRLTVHAEACPHLDRTLLAIRGLGLPAAVALNPHTPLCSLDWVLGGVGMVLLMTVNPGFGGQRFIAGSLGKIQALREKLAGMEPSRCIDIEVDGGIGLENVGLAAAAGANVFVAGSSLFGAPDMREAVGNMRAIAEAAAAAAYADKYMKGISHCDG
jgi:ribulose-phosphate 3-epimerase